MLENRQADTLITLISSQTAVIAYLLSIWQDVRDTVDMHTSVTLCCCLCDKTLATDIWSDSWRHFCFGVRLSQCIVTVDFCATEINIITYLLILHFLERNLVKQKVKVVIVIIMRSVTYVFVYCCSLLRCQCTLKFTQSQWRWLLVVIFDMHPHFRYA